MLSVVVSLIGTYIVVLVTGYIKDTVVPLFHKFFDQSFTNQDACFKAVTFQIGRICDLLKGRYTVFVYEALGIYKFEEIIAVFVMNITFQASR